MENQILTKPKAGPMLAIVCGVLCCPGVHLLSWLRFWKISRLV